MLREKISIDEFDGKRFQVRLIEPRDNKKAVLTHYLHNIHNGVSKHYKTDAISVLKEYVSYKQDEENTNILAEEALQQLLKIPTYLQKKHYNNFFLKLKTCHVQHPKIILLNLLTFLQVLVALDLLCKI